MILLFYPPLDLFMGICHTRLRLLTPYCSGEDPRQDIEECVRIPTLVSMANVYTSKKGALWNDNVRKSTVVSFC